MKATILVGRVEERAKELPEKYFDASVCDPPYGIEFMQAGWDKGVPPASLWREVLRTMKPGANLVAFSSSRTYHRMATYVEDAGFDIIDQLQWLYGTGWPKGIALDKAIAKIDAKQASRWEGWKTQLKPACEPACLAMRPLEGTFAQNAMTHGVAGLNVGESRIPSDEPIAAHHGTPKGLFGGKTGGPGGSSPYQRGDAGKILNYEGRYPSNVVMDEAAGRILDAQSGTLHTHGGNVKKTHATVGYGGGGSGSEREILPSSGGASRFFYCPKPSKFDRAPGNDHLTVKPVDLVRYFATLVQNPNAGRVFVPFAGSGSEMIGCLLAGWREVVGIEMDAKHATMAAKRIEKGFRGRVAVDLRDVA